MNGLDSQGAKTAAKEKTMFIKETSRTFFIKRPARILRSSKETTQRPKSAMPHVFPEKGVHGAQIQPDVRTVSRALAIESDVRTYYSHFLPRARAVLCPIGHGIH